MNDKLQEVINALRAAGDEAGAKAVEELRSAMDRTMQQYHAGQRDAYAEGRKDEAECALANWQPIETAPEDEHILIATTGGHVGTAYWTDEGDGKVWGWGHPEKDGGAYLHQNLTPLVWMPLPKHPEEA
jgi:hypothetical protein